jgi:hypothetical protein
MRLGLMPHDEFGLRFWDATMGAIAFLYVFAIGSLLAGPVCGAVALLVLFVHWPLLLDHGIRTNNMEAALLLSYCGGIYHYVRWSEDRQSRLTHAVAATLYFILGFMTKFVAIVFLPAIVGGAALLVNESRTRLLSHWRLWLGMAALALALIAPWFIYSYYVFGPFFWHKIFGESIMTRFTGTLVESHLRPWDFYFSTMFMFFEQEKVSWFVGAGLVVLVVQSIRRRSLVGLSVAFWALPLVIMSAGTSKLYHYAYPFLPPFALAVGYLAGLIVMLAPPQVRKALLAVEGWVGRRLPAVSAASSRTWLRALGTGIIWVAGGLAIGALIFGSVRLTWGHTVLFKSSGVVRPIVLMLVFGILMRRSATLATLVVALYVTSWLPIETYRDTVPRLVEEKHPMRNASDCIRRIEGDGSTLQGLYADTDGEMWHPIFYYFNRIRPWITPPAPSAETLDQTLHDPAAIRPSLVQEKRYRQYLEGPLGSRFARSVSPPMISMLGYQLLLPGPFGACSPEAPIHAGP